MVASVAEWIAKELWSLAVPGVQKWRALPGDPDGCGGLSSLKETFGSDSLRPKHETCARSDFHRSVGAYAQGQAKHNAIG